MESAAVSVLTALIRAHQPRAVLEVGTGNGHTSRSIIRAMPPGATFVTVEKHRQRLDVFAGAVGQPGVEVVPVAGDYGDEQVRFSIEQHAPFDVVLIDADWKNRVGEFAMVKPWLAEGAIVVAHDMGAASPGRAAIPQIRELGFELVEVWVPRGIVVAQVPTG